MSRSKLPTAKRKKRRRTERVDWDSQPLGLVSDRALAARLHLGHGVVRRERIRRGIEPLSANLDVSWDEQPLGEVSDSEIARKLGCAIGTVRRAREAREIDVWAAVQVDWSIQPLGRVSDASLALRLKCAQNTVARARQKRGIPPWRRHAPIDWDEEPLGLVVDKALAEALGVSATKVHKERVARGIPAFIPRPPQKDVNWADVPLGKRPDIDLARELGVDEQRVRAARDRAGLAPYQMPLSERRQRRGHPDIDWDEQPLGEMADRQLAARLGCSDSAVFMARHRRGIPSFASRSYSDAAKRRSKRRKKGEVNWDAQPLGVVSDKELAARLGTTMLAVRAQRSRRGIAAGW